MQPLSGHLLVLKCSIRIKWPLPKVVLNQLGAKHAGPHYHCTAATGTSHRLPSRNRFPRPWLDAYGVRAGHGMRTPTSPLVARGGQ